MFSPNFERTAAPAAGEGYRLEIDIPIPMRDGVRLATDMYFPTGPGPNPVLLERTPYGKHQSVMVSIQAPQFLARHGFAVAVQDTRGRYASEGVWYPFLEEAWGEKQDGFDTVEWLGRQPWSTGKVGTFGGSFAGFNQYLHAGAPSPHLEAMFARQAPSSLRREWVYRGGAFELGFMFMWGARQSLETLRNRAVQLDRQSSQDQMALLGAKPLADAPFFSDPFQWIKDYLRFQEDQSYWKQWDIAPHHSAFQKPVHHVASWYDIFLGGSLKNFTGMRAGAVSEEVRRGHRLTIGPWLHGPLMDSNPEGRTAGEIDFGEAARWNYKGEMARWFEYWLSGRNNGILEEPAVRYFVMGRNQWKSADDWPPRGAAYRKLFLHAKPSGTSGSLNDGSLDWNPPAAVGEPVSFVHDPDHPTPSAGGNTLYSLKKQKPGESAAWADLNAEAGSQDQRKIEPQCLTFTSAPLDQEMEVTGPVIARLFISSSAVDTDFVVRLCDVHPDGRSMLICDGIQRARYRESDFEPRLLEPGKIYELTIDLWATSILLPAGHRFRVVVNSSSFPRFDVNPGTGESAATATRRVPAENRVYVDGAHASHVVLPLIQS